MPSLLLFFRPKKKKKNKEKGPFSDCPLGLFSFFCLFDFPFSLLSSSFSFSLSPYLLSLRQNFQLSTFSFQLSSTHSMTPVPSPWLPVTFLNSPFHPPWVQSNCRDTALITITDPTCPWARAPKAPWRYGPLIARASGTPSKWPVPKLLTSNPRLLNQRSSLHWAANHPNAKATARHGRMLQTAGAAPPSCRQIDLSHL